MKKFAERNHISIVKRPEIWEYILEPFLDMSFSESEERKTLIFLNQFGLSEDRINNIRKRVNK